MDSLLPSEVKDIKAQIQEVVAVFSKELLRALCALVIQDAKRTIEQTEIKKESRQKKLNAKKPRKDRKKKPKQIPPKSNFRCCITSWKENRLIDHYGVYEIQISFEDGSATRRAYKRFREFEVLHKKAGRQVPAFSMPATSGSSITGDDGLKRRTSMDRIIGFLTVAALFTLMHRAKYLQPLLDALCSTPNPWESTKLIEFLGLDEEQGLWQQCFDAAISETRRRLAIPAEPFYCTSRAETFERLLFFRIRPLWEIAKASCPTKPMKALCGKVVGDAIIKGARSLEPVWDQARSLKLRLEKNITAVWVALANVETKLRDTLQYAVEPWATHFETVFTTTSRVSVKQLVALFASDLAALQTRLQVVLAETLENADPTLFVMCENAANDIKEKVAQLLDTQISAMLQDIVLEINRVAPKPLDLVAAPLKNALPVIKVCFEFLLSPKYTLDALAEIISTRAKIEELDPLQNLPQIDQLLEQQETIAREKAQGVSWRYACDARELLRKLRHLQLPESLEHAAEIFAMGVAKMWSKALLKIARKFTDYAQVLARMTTKEQWKQTVRDAFLVATKKTYKKMAKILKSLARQVITAILEEPFRTLASEIASKFDSVAFQLGLPSELTDVVEPSVRFLPEAFLVRKMASAVMEMRIFDPIHALWKSTFKDQSRTSPGQFNMTSEPSNLVQLQMRYTVMRKRDAELWDKQKTIVFSGVAPTAPILLPSESMRQLPVMAHSPAAVASPNTVPVVMLDHSLQRSTYVPGFISFNLDMVDPTSPRIGTPPQNSPLFNMTPTSDPYMSPPQPNTAALMGRAGSHPQYPLSASAPTMVWGSNTAQTYPVTMQQFGGSTPDLMALRRGTLRIDSVILDSPTSGGLAMEDVFHATPSFYAGVTPAMSPVASPRVPHHPMASSAPTTMRNNTTSWYVGVSPVMSPVLSPRSPREGMPVMMNNTNTISGAYSPQMYSSQMYSPQMYSQQMSSSVSSAEATPPVTSPVSSPRSGSDFSSGSSPATIPNILGSPPL